ncbi:unnamed protein product [Bursaphelenchus okinawaensis]|uniref:Protein-tyrosine phosphatase n=1 Tax=Bursaphelenchus okinawaensis TaxID=465554 RepID=A0A811LMS8_9BILA|nr:unnamed protein product [Bursaphelenchus okinawaensis]CAG9127012.1 unnamed protein product [Bursaphelenchus okinawaensis]
MNAEHEAWLNTNIVKKNVEAHRADFASLKKALDPKDFKTFLAQPQGTRNRYRDVVCLEATRVKLKGLENDYIHANYVSTPKSDKRIICTQGPTDTTCGDFWTMILQEKSAVIIMLCNFYEKNIKKCAEYFPVAKGQSVTFEKIKVTCTSQQDMGLDEAFNVVKLRLSQLVVTRDKNKMEVDHYQWLDWPDRGVPEGDVTAINLLQKVGNTKYPIVVHCSAGIGRTGSIVMLQYLLDATELGKPCDKLDQILATIRDQRALSVQNEQQYLYVIRVFLDYLLRKGLVVKDSDGRTPKHITHMRKFLSEYTAAIDGK